MRDYCGDLLLLPATKLGDLECSRTQLPGKSKVVFDGVDAPFQLGTNNERRLNPKNRIALQKFIAFEEQMSDEGAIARRADHEMNVRGSEGMSSHCREQLTRGTVIRNWIADRHDGSESIGACHASVRKLALR